MKYLILIIATLCSTLSLGQKTKILLIGTIHFETPHKDKYELTTDNFLSEQRQNELEKVTQLLAKTKASKVMIERPREEQTHFDSLYSKYLTNQYQLTVSEREQI